MHSVEARPAQRTVRCLRIVGVLVLCLLPVAAWAAECNIEIEPHFRGFGLNPVVEKVVITSVRPARSAACVAFRRWRSVSKLSSTASPLTRPAMVSAWAMSMVCAIIAHHV